MKGNFLNRIGVIKEEIHLQIFDLQVDLRTQTRIWNIKYGNILFNPIKSHYLI